MSKDDLKSQHADKDTMEAALRRVAACKKFQGQGHGRVLGTLVEEFAKQYGVDKVCLNADKEAAGYYASLGFKPELWSREEYESCRDSRVMLIQIVIYL